MQSNDPDADVTTTLGRTTTVESCECREATCDYSKSSVTTTTCGTGYPNWRGEYTERVPCEARDFERGSLTHYVNDDGEVWTHAEHTIELAPFDMDHPHPRPGTEERINSKTKSGEGIFADRTCKFDASLLDENKSPNPNKSDSTTLDVCRAFEDQVERVVDGLKRQKEEE